jgi:carbonic anhydrase
MPTKKVLSGHRQFKKRFESEKELFERLAEKGQSPKVFWIGCSDSRVVPEHITGADHGELFILRNIANIVPPAHTETHMVGAAVEYSILYLRVEHVVVCGHSDCGGIKALETELDHAREPHIIKWLEHARTALDSVKKAGVPESERHLATVKANVLNQLDNLRSYQCVQDGIKNDTLALHGWLYDIRSGEMMVYNEASGEWVELHAPR